jgi:hypothetical protein
MIHMAGEKDGEMCNALLKLLYERRVGYPA